MTLDELESLIKAGDIEVIRAPWQIKRRHNDWLVAAHGKPSVDTFGNTLTYSSREKKEMEYTGLDRAYAVIKKAGYMGRFEVDDGSIFPHNVAQ